MRLKTTGGVVACVFIFAAVLPAEIYQYTGHNYSMVSGTYLMTQSVNATFILASPLATGATSVPTPTSWSVSDGANTLNEGQDCDNLDSLSLTTDVNGNITDWYFVVDDGELVTIFSAGPTGEMSGLSSLDSAITDTYYAKTMSPGTWADTTNGPTPEPGTLSTMLAGALLLARMSRRLRLIPLSL